MPGEQPAQFAHAVIVQSKDELADLPGTRAGDDKFSVVHEFGNDFFPTECTLAGAAIDLFHVYELAAVPQSDDHAA